MSTTTAPRVRSARLTRVVLLAALLATAAATSVGAASFPGLPFSWLLVAVLTWCSALVAAGRIATSRRTVVGLVAPLVVVSTVAALVGTSNAAGTPLAVRFAASQADFQRVVDDAGPVDPADRRADPGLVVDLPGECPIQIGFYHITACRAFAEGYLFLQAPDAVTDVSGFAYLPNGLPPYREDGSGMDSTGYTHLDGPWYAWTCHC